MQNVNKAFQVVSSCFQRAIRMTLKLEVTDDSICFWDSGVDMFFSNSKSKISTCNLKTKLPNMH